MKIFLCTVSVRTIHLHEDIKLKKKHCGPQETSYSIMSILKIWIGGSLYTWMNRSEKAKTSNFFS